MVMGFVWLGLMLVVAYLFGSIPTGYLAGRILKGIDIREQGSRSTGATNVLRTLGTKPAIAVLLIDVIKGALAVAFPRLLFSFSAVTDTLPPDTNLQLGLPWVLTLAGLTAIFGHSCSVWINFTGGKSVASSLGVLFTLSWLLGLGALAMFGVVIALSRIVSLSSIAAAIAAILLAFVLQEPLPYQLLAISGGGYVIWRHRANIQRLIAGTEPRIGQKPPESSTVSE